MDMPEPHTSREQLYADVQLYREAVSCLELVANHIEKDLDYDVIRKLYDRCTYAISMLQLSQNNPLFSASLQSLLQTLNMQQSLLESQYGNLRDNLPSKSGDDNGRTGRQMAVEDMLIKPERMAPVNGLDDLAGLEEAKQVLREAFVIPVQLPHLFQEGLKPWTRLLLYGPPGTGKTKLARALASELCCKFYCVSSASLLSSWVGESEKLIRELFTHAQSSSEQSVIFFDEIDSLCRKRSQTEDEHSRRIKTELLCQMEEVESSGRVFLLAATNCPWDLDPAFLRRFQRRIFIPLPDREGRQAIITKQFPNVVLKLKQDDWDHLLDCTEGFSGADLAHLVTAAAFIPIHHLQTSRFWCFTEDNKITPCGSDDLGAMQFSLNKLPANKVVARAVELGDFQKAMETTPKTVTEEMMQQYHSFSASNYRY